MYIICRYLVSPSLKNVYNIIIIFQPRYSYKIYSYKQKKGVIRLQLDFSATTTLKGNKRRGFTRMEMKEKNEYWLPKIT